MPREALVPAGLNAHERLVARPSENAEGPRILTRGTFPRNVVRGNVRWCQTVLAIQ